LAYSHVCFHTYIYFPLFVFLSLLFFSLSFSLSLNFDDDTTTRHTTTMTGHEVDSAPGLLDSAVDYVKIRAFSMPTSLLLGVVQATLLGAKDSVTPLIAILYSTIVNVIGDYILVKHYNMGLRGAAIATLLAQWAATAALLGPARRRLVKDKRLGVWGKPKTNNNNKNKSAASAVSKDSVTSRTFLGFAAPVLTLILGKLAAFGFMTHSAGE
jgi:Na+-driven multidrug efflux pump